MTSTPQQSPTSSRKLSVLMPLFNEEEFVALSVGRVMAAPLPDGWIWKWWSWTMARRVDFPKLLDPLLSGRADVVYGSRFMVSGER